jgi:hypothetical protein
MAWEPARSRSYGTSNGKYPFGITTAAPLSQMNGCASPSACKFRAGHARTEDESDVVVAKDLADIACISREESLVDIGEDHHVNEGIHDV